MKVRRSLALVIVFFFLLVLPIAARYVSYYAGPADRPEVDRPALDTVAVPTPPAAQYSDETIHPGDGVVVVDMAHGNQLEMPELNVLASRLAARGHRLTAWSGGSLEDALLDASAFLVAVPLQVYNPEEVDAVEEFVRSGGRLLLIGDPTRFSYLTDEWDVATGIDSDARYLNELGTSFGITFVDDYLYNVSDNEGSFRDIKLRDWRESELTEGLESVVFFAAHSLAVANDAAVIRADNETWSSATDRAGGLVVVAQAEEGRVLALGDLTFMTEPYHTVRDNSRLILHIADFLTGAERSYVLADFPRFFGDEVAFVFTNDPELGPGQLQLVGELQELMDSTGRTLVLADEPDSDSDTVFAGLYSQAGPITDTLARFGVTVIYTPTREIEEAGSGTAEEAGDQATADEVSEEVEQQADGLVSIDGLGSYDMRGIALIVFYSTEGRQVLTVLAASQEGLANALDRLSEGNLDDCVLADLVTLCPSDVPSEELETSWQPIEAPSEEPAEAAGELPEGVEGELAYGDTVSGELGQDEEHLWVFSGVAGDVVTIRVEAGSAEMDLVLELEDPDGDLLISADTTIGGEAEEIGSFELPATGDYTIRVRDFSGRSGSYTLSLELAEEETGAETTAGTIEIGETVQGTLAPRETAVWTFHGEADQAIAITLQPDEGGDVTLELQDEQEHTLESSDSGLGGEEERIEGRLPSTGGYRILVEEFFGEPVSYTLTLAEGGGGGVLGSWGVLVVSADVGSPAIDGRTSADIYVDVLSPDYDVTLWTLSVDGQIELEDMQGYQMVIWASGDFQGGDQLGLFSYLADEGSLLLSGAYPAIADGEDTAALRDVEVSSSASVLTAGLTPGEIIELSGSIDCVVFGFEEEEDAIPVLLRGPASEETGDVIAVGLAGGDYSNLQLLLIGFPLYVLPESVQAQVIINAVEWFQVTSLP